MQRGVFVLVTMAYSAAAFAVEGKTVTLSVTICRPSLSPNCGLLTDGGFSATRLVATPMQRASCVVPTLLLSSVVFLLLFQPAGMSVRTSRARCAWAS